MKYTCLMKAINFDLLDIVAIEAVVDVSGREEGGNWITFHKEQLIE